MDIFIPDGTLQCGLGQEIPLEVTNQALTTLEVVPSNPRKATLPYLYPQACGLPTGRCNVFSVTEDEWREKGRDLRALGFRAWPVGGTQANEEQLSTVIDSNQTLRELRENVGSVRPLGGDLTPFPFSADALSSKAARMDGTKALRDILGMRIRVYKVGDVISMDYRLDRVNVPLEGSSGAIVDVWCG